MCTVSKSLCTRPHISVYSHRGICLLSNESSSTTECVPLCETMGLSLCTCDEEEEECMVCCSGPGRACRPIDGEPLVDGSSCQGGEGVCRNVSVSMCCGCIHIITCREGVQTEVRTSLPECGPSL